MRIFPFHGTALSEPNFSSPWTWRWQLHEETFFCRECSTSKLCVELYFNFMGSKASLSHTDISVKSSNKNGSFRSIIRQLSAIISAKRSYKHTKQFYEPPRSTSSVLRRNPEMLLERAASGQSAHHMAARATCLDMCKYAYLDIIIREENFGELLVKTMSLRHTPRGSDYILKDRPLSSFL